VLGKAMTAQLPLGPMALVVLGSVLGAPVGSAVSHRVPVDALRVILAGVVTLVGVGVWWDLLGR
jgi:uncharacterized membrane protein YfcA